MTVVNRGIPTYYEPVDRAAITSRTPMATTGPLFSNLDIAAGIVAAVMLLGPLAMAAFAVH